MRRIRAVAVIGLLLTAMTITVAAPAYAAPDKPDFAAQASDAGLTSAEAASLQQRVNAYLARMGGTQVAINKIDLAGKGVLLLTLPGESRAREVGTAVTPDKIDCFWGYFCAYSAPDWSGDQLTFYYCAYKLSMPFAGFGSYDNSQTPGTSAHFYDSNGAYMYDSLGGQSSSTPFYWSPVYWIKPCGGI